MFLVAESTPAFQDGFSDLQEVVGGVASGVAAGGGVAGGVPGDWPVSSCPQPFSSFPRRLFSFPRGGSWCGWWCFV